MLPLGALGSKASRNKKYYYSKNPYLWVRVRGGTLPRGSTATPDPPMGLRSLDPVISICSNAHFSKNSLLSNFRLWKIMCMAVLTHRNLSETGSVYKRTKSLYLSIVLHSHVFLMLSQNMICYNGYQTSS